MNKLLEFINSEQFTVALIALKAFTITIGYWFLATGLVNLVAHKSQVDTWCEKRPKLAAILKILRGIGFDPWLLIQAASLWVTGRLPAKLRVLIPVFIALTLLPSCAVFRSPTFWDLTEEACVLAMAARPEIIAEAKARNLTGNEWAAGICKLSDVIEQYAVEKDVKKATDRVLFLLRPKGLVK